MIEMTPREQQVLDGIARGLPDKTIAWELGLQRYTVRDYVQGAMRKLGAKNRAHAVTLGFKAGLLSLEVA